MNNQHKAAEAAVHTAANEKAPGVDAAQGHENTKTNCLNFRQATWKRQIEALQAAGMKRISVGLVVDLETYPLSHVRTLIQNTDALKQLSLTGALGFRYAVVAGPLSKKDGGTFSATLHEDGIADTLPKVVMVACSRMVEIGEQATVWDFMVDDALLARLKSAIGGAA
jgi:hypothetical protein